MGRSPLLFIVSAALALPAAAAAAPPANDAPTAAEPFTVFTAANGRPDEQQAVAELFEATADAGLPRCLGPASFARTVWYRVPEAPTAQRLTVEAMGRTLDVLDVAAFVQAEVPAPPPPPPPPPPEPTPTPTPEPTPGPTARASQAPPAPASEVNVCSGIGAGAGEESEEPTAGVTLHVPPRHPVLIQVGRRGAARSPDDDRAVISLEQRALDLPARPAGDAATAAPAARNGRDTYVDVFGATITGEDPAQPACPSLGTVWRKFTPGASGKRLIRAFGPGVETLTVFSGTRPTAANALDCVNRETAGALEMVVPVRKRTPVWIRIGSESTIPGTQGTLQVLEGRNATVVDGGPGGADPTTGGPGGGFPAACFSARPERARVSGPALRGPAPAYNRFARVPLKVVAVGASLCDVELRLRGPRGGIYAKGRAVRVKGRTTVRLSRLRTFRKGRYRLTVTAVNQLGRRVNVRTRLGGRLR